MYNWTVANNSDSQVWKLKVSTWKVMGKTKYTN